MRPQICLLCALLTSVACGSKPADAPAAKTPAPIPAPVAASSKPAPAAPMPPLGLVVTSPGSEPRRGMGYGKLQGVPFELRFDTETATKRGNLVSPTIVVAGRFHPAIEGDGGIVSFDIASVTAVDRERQLVDAAGINYYLKGYKPPSFVLDVTAAGELGPDASAWKFPDMLFNQEQALHDILAKWTLVLPEVAIGPGATWTQVERDVVNGVALTRATEAKLFLPEAAPEIKPDAATSASATPHPALRASATFREVAEPQQAMPGGQPLQVISYQAEGTLEFAFVEASPWLGTSTGRSTTSLVYEHQGKQETIVRKTTWTLTPAASSRKRKQ